MELIGNDVVSAHDASTEFVGRWNLLISTTNWEKGRIISEWRQALIDQDAPASDYSDESWSVKVGGVTGQHVGRLRRVYDRFGEVCDQYQGLFWSHFQAALDWDDAEMWLEGAVQNDWSVSHMRRQRWETLGAVDDDEPKDEDIVTSEIDEDFTSNDADEPHDDNTLTTTVGQVHDAPGRTESDATGARSDADADDGAVIYSENDKDSVSFVRPFENLKELPDDLQDAFENYKLAILRHKAAKWKEVSREDVLASLEALSELARAPSNDLGP